MASEPERHPADDDTVVLGPDARPAPDETAQPALDETTQPIGDWPVTDLYYVEPDEEAAAGPADADRGGTIVATTTAAPVETDRRRFPPDVRLGPLLVLLGVLAAIVLGAIFLVRDDDPTAAPPPQGGAQPTTPVVETTPQPAANSDVAVKDVQGMTLEQAKTALEKQSLGVRVRRSSSDRPEGEVLSQAPAAGDEVAPKTVVALVVSGGTGTGEQPRAQVEVPSLVGRSASSAVSAVRELGLEARVRLVSSSERAGTVVDQSPDGGAVLAEGETVELEVAKAHREIPHIEVPDVVGSTAADARSKLRAAGLSVSTVTVVAQDPAGTVIEQSPQAGAELRKGGRVTLTVSSGPAKVDVPDVTGLDEASARQELERAGFQVQVTDESTTDPAQDGTVVRQSPPGGSSARDGAMVTITVARID
jgi:beta-lactam-binding protein with PASTA domain